MDKENESVKKEEISIRGKMIRDMIARVTSTHLLGKKIKSGELRKNPKELPWKVPEHMKLTPVKMEFFDMEYLESAQETESDIAILQLHGGGYIGPLWNGYRSFAALYHELSQGAPVLTIDYRVAPEHRYPAALQDALAAFEWLQWEKKFEPSQIVIAGDSAGGGLALGLCHYLKDEGKKLPKGLILMSPWTDMTASGSSYEENFEKDPLFGNTKDSLLYNRDYLGEEDPENPYVSPLFGNFKDFPPMLIQAGSIEMLLSDSLMVAKKAKEAGCKVRMSVYEGMFHVFQMAQFMMPESKQAWMEIRRFLNLIREMES